MGLHLGMEITEWPPENIEDMAAVWKSRTKTVDRKKRTG